MTYSQFSFNQAWSFFSRKKFTYIHISSLPVKLLSLSNSFVGLIFLISGFSMVAPVSNFAQDCLINTFAGDGTGGFGGDAGVATAAQLNFPFGVEFDAAGNLYIADFSNHRIRKVDAGGTITTVAGTGTAGFSGDAGLAATARLSFPAAMAFDAAGNLFISDRGNGRVRKVDIVSGIITTVVGGGIGGTNGDGGLATFATLNQAVGLAFDAAGNLFIAEQAENRIRKVDIVSGIITTVAGKGTGGFSGDGGAATAAEIDRPTGVAIDAAGNLFIADQANDRIRKVDASGIITTVIGNGVSGFSGDGGLATAAQIDGPVNLEFDAMDNLFIAEVTNNRIRKVDSNGNITTVAGNGTGGFSGDGGVAIAAELNSPVDIAIDAANNLFIADGGNNRIRRLSGPCPVGTPPAPSISSTVSSSTAPIPTLSQWGLLVFGLLVLNLSIFFVQRIELV